LIDISADILIRVSYENLIEKKVDCEKKNEKFVCFEKVQSFLVNRDDELIFALTTVQDNELN
jgi:hypothetical protein